MDRIRLGQRSVRAHSGRACGHPRALTPGLMWLDDDLDRALPSVPHKPELSWPTPSTVRRRSAVGRQVDKCSESDVDRSRVTASGAGGTCVGFSCGRPGPGSPRGGTLRALPAALGPGEPEPFHQTELTQLGELELAGAARPEACCTSRTGVPAAMVSPDLRHSST